MNKFVKRILATTGAFLCVGVAAAADIASGFYFDAITGYLQGYGINSDAVDFESSKETCEQLESEGIVLLKNNGALPLANKNVAVFGWSSTSIAYSGGGSGSSSAVKSAVTLFDGLKNAGITINEDVSNFYKNYKDGRDEDNYWSSQYPYLNLIEPSASSLSTLVDSASEKSDTAIYVISRLGGEHQDLPKRQVKWNGETDNTKTYLEISTEEAETINLIATKFDKVIVIVNSINTMNLSFLDTLDIDAAISVGAVGQYGTNSIGKVLTGEVNPSGRTTDTYAYDFSTSSTYANSPDGHNTDTSTSGVKKYTDIEDYYIDYSENIYVGYKWYETADKEGFWNSTYAYNKWGINGYDEVVQYPFGYGLSYTKFKWDVTNITPKSGASINSETKIKISVDVTNIGTVKGKDVVELYYGASYNNNDIEKSASNLIAFEKTKELEPGAKQSITFTVKGSDLKSYDTYDQETYVLDYGRYDFLLGPNCHFDSDSIHEADGNNKFFYRVTDSEVLSDDETTGEEVYNKFTGSDALDGGYSIDGSNTNANITYLSRSNFEATFPTNKSSRSSYGLLKDWTNDYVDTDVMPTLEKERNLDLFVDGELNTTLIIDYNLGSDYNSKGWTAVVDQLKKQELIDSLLYAGYQTNEIETINKPKFRDLDGPQGLNTSVMSSESASVQFTFFPSETVMAQTWSTDLLVKYGVTIAKEAQAEGVNVSGWYAPGANIHRSPFGGRNFEYYSEDSFLSGKMAASCINGATNNGVYCYLKHFAVNETACINNGASNGLNTWLTEQALREIYLKPFEIAVKEGKANAIMCAYNDIGHTWCGASYALLTEVLRNEWGFQGSVVTDAWTIGNDFYDMDDGLRAGVDILLNSANDSFSVGAIIDDTSSPTAIKCMKRAVKNVLYTYANTIYRNYKTNGVINGKSATEVTPTWVWILVGANILLIGGGFTIVYFEYIRRKPKNEGGK